MQGMGQTLNFAQSTIFCRVNRLVSAVAMKPNCSVLPFQLRYGKREWTVREQSQVGGRYYDARSKYFSSANPSFRELSGWVERIVRWDARRCQLHLMRLRLMDVTIICQVKILQATRFPLISPLSPLKSQREMTFLVLVHSCPLLSLAPRFPCLLLHENGQRELLLWDYYYEVPHPFGSSASEIPLMELVGSSSVVCFCGYVPGPCFFWDLDVETLQFFDQIYHGIRSEFT